MADILHRVGIAAPQARVYEALTTTEGLSGWWTRDVKGDPNLGGTLQFFFGSPEPGAAMEVVALTPGQHVEWRCVQGPDEWLGTTISFDLKPADGETAVLFKQANWREPVEFMHHCSTKWAYFLLGLKAGLEDGEATPYPNDKKISSWG
ncbi:MAG: SRPBCC family protein [Ktedonobacterales bacterium]